MVDLNLTKRQQEIFDFIRRYVSEYGYPPTVRDIGKAVGLTSSSTVHAHLRNLEGSGCCAATRPSRGRSRCWSDKARQTVKPRACPSSVRSPPAHLCSPTRTSRSTCRSRHRGRRGGRVRPARQGRLDEGRRDPRRDYVIVRRQETATDGDIVVALVGEEATVKRFFREADHVRLQPENPALEPILTKRSRCSARWSASAGRCHERRAAGIPGLSSPPPARERPAGRTTLEQLLDARGTRPAATPRPSARSARRRCAWRASEPTAAAAERRCPERRPAGPPRAGRPAGATATCCPRLGPADPRRSRPAGVALRPSPDQPGSLNPLVLVKQPREGRRDNRPLEESPDTAGQGGR